MAHVHAERDRAALRHEPDVHAPQAESAPVPRLLQLQGQAGNRAVAGLVARVQRQDGQAPAGPDPAVAPGTDTADRPLDAREVADAIRFHRVQPWAYTPAIVARIRDAVGVGAGEAVDEAMVQAIARWQRDQGSHDPNLVVDGKAGPRTLPRLFPNGLNAPGEGQTFGEAAQDEVIGRWGELTPAERAAELVRLVNDRLTAAGVPAVTPDPTDTGVAAGEFDFTTWGLQVGLPALSDAQLSRDEAASIVDTIYHEARHAEQWFRMAQMRAGRGRSAQAIATEMVIPRAIADAAVADPLEADSMQALVARGWFESVYGSDSAHRERVLGEVVAAAEARNAAQEAFDDDPTPANEAAMQAARARFDAAFADYRELPEENDAWATGPMAGDAITEGSPAPGAAGDEESAGEQSGASGAAPAPPASGPSVDPRALSEAAPVGGPTELGGLAEQLAGVLGGGDGARPDRATAGAGASPSGGRPGERHGEAP